MIYDQPSSSLTDRTAPSSSSETTTPISIAPYHRDHQQQQSCNATAANLEPVDPLISSVNYSDTVHKIKTILDSLQKKLIQPPASQTMTPDSLKSTLSIQTTYSVSSNLPSMYENTDVPCPILLNAAHNINGNQQTSDDDSSAKNSHRSRSRSGTVHYMSPSFMFTLQLLLVAYIFHRFVCYFHLGVVPTVPAEQ